MCHTTLRDSPHCVTFGLEDILVTHAIHALVSNQIHQCYHHQHTHRWETLKVQIHFGYEGIAAAVTCIILYPSL